MNRTFKTVALPILVVFVLVYVAQSMFHFGGSGTPTKKAGWGSLVATANSDPKSIQSVKFNQSNVKVTWVLSNGTKFSAGYPRTGDAADKLVDTLVKSKQVPAEAIEFSGVGGNEWLSLLLGALPFVLFLGLWIFLINQMQGGGSKVMSFGKSRAKRMAVDSPKITFKDVAGADEAVEELHEIKEFLENPKKFQALGARIPKGVLLYGPPGTGKTLLARAVAGEAGVPFFSISGSDFVEMFVGVGASRVRDLFEQAKQNAPCIIFMDEIDAVGRHRGAGLGGGHDEREQTLNQLLVEMDGFELKDNIILIAATNRPDILDPALLRPGRFDRQIVVDRPDRDGRKKILEVHTKGKPIAREIDLGALAGQTPGFTGADLANLVNEAALLSARRGRKVVGQDELEEGIMRVIAGPEKKTRLLSEKERLVTAYHEMGHALVAHLPRGLRPGAQDLRDLARPGARLHDLDADRGHVPHDPHAAARHARDDAGRARRRGARLRRAHHRRRQRPREGDRDRQGDDHALRHEREARPARVRPQPRPALPGPGVLAGAGLLRGGRARDRRRDPAHRRGGRPARQDRAGRARGDAAPPLQDPARARDDRPRAVPAAARRRHGGRGLPAALGRAPAEPVAEPKPRRSAASSRGFRASRASPTPSRAARSLSAGVAPLSERYARGALVGVLNVTPDSFSDGGEFRRPRVRGRAWPPAADEGAAIVDVGGESTRPGAEPVSAELELARVLPVIEGLAADGIAVSVDTSKAEVAQAALAAGAVLVNDVTALRGDPEMAAVVAGAGADLCLMHMLGEPRTMQDDPRYDDVVAEVESFLAERAEVAVAAGVPSERIALDPGIGFGKTLAHNLELLRALPRLARLGPLLLGVSRKRFLGALTGRRSRPTAWPPPSPPPLYCYRGGAPSCACTTCGPRPMRSPSSGRWRAARDRAPHDRGARAERAGQSRRARTRARGRAALPARPRPRAELSLGCETDRLGDTVSYGDAARMAVEVPPRRAST